MFGVPFGGAFGSCQRAYADPSLASAIQNENTEDPEIALGIERSYLMDRSLKAESCCFPSQYPLTRGEAFRNGLAHETVERYKRKIRSFRRKLSGSNTSALEEEMHYIRNEIRKIIADLLILEELFFEELEAIESTVELSLQEGHEVKVAPSDLWELAYVNLYFIEKNFLGLDLLVTQLKLYTGLYRARAVPTAFGFTQQKFPYGGMPSRIALKREARRQAKIKEYEREIELISEFLEQGQVFDAVAAKVNFSHYDEWKVSRHRGLEVPLRLSFASGKAIGRFARNGLKAGAAIGLGVATGNPVIIAGGAFVAASGCARMVHTLAEVHAHNQIDFHPSLSRIEKIERKELLRKKLSRIASAHEMVDLLVPLALAPAAITVGALGHITSLSSADHVPVGAVGSADLPGNSVLAQKLPILAEATKTAVESPRRKE